MEHCDLITICFTGTYLEECETISVTRENRTFAIIPEKYVRRDLSTLSVTKFLRYEIQETPELGRHLSI